LFDLISSLKSLERLNFLKTADHPVRNFGSSSRKEEDTVADPIDNPIFLRLVAQIPPLGLAG
jgi:hypothetical protein